MTHETYIELPLNLLLLMCCTGARRHGQGALAPPPEMLKSVLLQMLSKPQ